MSDESPNGCMCEICHPNLYLGQDEDFFTRKPEERPETIRNEPRDDSRVPTKNGNRFSMAA